MGRPANRRDGGRLSPAARRAAIVLLLLAVGCSGIAPAPVRPPLPRDLGQSDPALVELIEQTVAAVVASPQDPTVWRRLGTVYQANRWYDMAADSYSQAVALDASDPRTWYGLGVSRANLGQATAALDAFERAANMTDYAPLAWRRGFLLLDLGRLEDARTAFEHSVARNAHDPAGQAGLARVELLQGDATAAIARLEPLVAKGAKGAKGAGGRGQPYLQHLLGLAYRQAGRPDAAAAALTRGRNSVAVWRDPWTEENLTWRRGFDWTLSEARRALADGRHDVALPALEQLRQARPDDRELLATLGTAFAAAGREREATEAFRELARHHPDDYRAHYELSRYHDRGQRYRQALQHAERAIELNDEYPAAWRQRARVLRHQGRAAECEQAGRRATELAPADTDAWMLVGECRMDLEHWSAAATAFERAATEAPGRGSTWLRLAQAAMLAGDRPRAETALAGLRKSGSAGAARADVLAGELGLEPEAPQ